MIETKIEELIVALNANTEALNKVLASSGAPVVTTATPAAEAPEKPKRGKAKAAEPEPEETSTGMVLMTYEPVEPEPVKPESVVEEPAAEETPEPEAPAVSGYTPADIRDYVRDYQAHITKQGGNTAAALEAVKTLRSEFGVASLNDLTVEQCGPFFAKVKAALPM